MLRRVLALVVLWSAQAAGCAAVTTVYCENELAQLVHCDCSRALRVTTVREARVAASDVSLKRCRCT